MAATLTRIGIAKSQLTDKWKYQQKEEGLPRRGASTSSRSSFTRKCARLVKEQRARFYIIRRCVAMLICWQDSTDS